MRITSLATIAFAVIGSTSTVASAQDVENGQSLFRQLAAKLGDECAMVGAFHLLQPFRLHQGLAPVLFLLVNIEQTAQGGRRLGIAFDQFGKKQFSTVQEPGPHVVFTKLQ